jgi:hypothetical protein
MHASSADTLPTPTENEAREEAKLKRYLTRLLSLSALMGDNAEAQNNAGKHKA